MATDNLRDILDQIKHLPLADQRRLAADLEQVIADSAQGNRSILELRGLGKELWQDMDAQEYVSQERASWSR